MLKHSTTINIEAPTKGVAQQKKGYLEQISKLETGTLQILANKSKKQGIAQKLRQFQHLI